MQENKFYFFSKYNFINKLSEKENEDCIYTDRISNLAIADGAGGVGVFNKSWAKYLVTNYNKDFSTKKKKWNKWFKWLSETFYNKIIQDTRFSNSLIQNKFYEEGSYSTLLQIKLVKNKLHYWGCGDTMLIIFSLDSNRAYQLREVYPRNNISNLNDNPNLLNWNSKILNWDMPKSITLKDNDILICCTDALYRYIIRTLFNYDPLSISEYFTRDFLENLKLEQSDTTFHVTSNALIEEIVNLCIDEANLEANLSKMINQGLEADDYTLAILKFSNND